MIPLIELSKNIEKIIKKFKIEYVYTHFGEDVNQDHKKVFEATLIATRPTPNSLIKRVCFYETPSSTEWGLGKFQPNLFVDIGKFLDKKINAIKKYKDEIHDVPHPRSIEAIIARSNYWGSGVGIKHVEPFIIIREILKNS